MLSADTIDSNRAAGSRSTQTNGFVPSMQQSQNQSGTLRAGVVANPEAPIAGPSSQSASTSGPLRRVRKPVVTLEGMDEKERAMGAKLIDPDFASLLPWPPKKFQPCAMNPALACFQNGPDPKTWSRESWNRLSVGVKWNIIDILTAPNGAHFTSTLQRLLALTSEQILDFVGAFSTSLVEWQAHETHLKEICEVGAEDIRMAEQIARLHGMTYWDYQFLRRPTLPTDNLSFQNVLEGIRYLEGLGYNTAAIYLRNRTLQGRNDFIKLKMPFALARASSARDWFQDAVKKGTYTKAQYDERAQGTPAAPSQSCNILPTFSDPEERKVLDRIRACWPDLPGPLNSGELGPTPEYWRPDFMPPAFPFATCFEATNRKLHSTPYDADSMLWNWDGTTHESAWKGQYTGTRGRYWQPVSDVTHIIPVTQTPHQTAQKLQNDFRKAVAYYLKFGVSAKFACPILKDLRQPLPVTQRGASKPKGPRPSAGSELKMLVDPLATNSQAMSSDQAMSNIFNCPVAQSGPSITRQVSMIQRNHEQSTPVTVQAGLSRKRTAVTTQPDEEEYDEFEPSAKRKKAAVPQQRVPETDAKTEKSKHSTPSSDDVPPNKRTTKSWLENKKRKNGKKAGIWGLDKIGKIPMPASEARTTATVYAWSADTALFASQATMAIYAKSARRVMTGDELRQCRFLSKEFDKGTGQGYDLALLGPKLEAAEATNPVGQRSVADFATLGGVTEAAVCADFATVALFPGRIEKEVEDEDEEGEK